MTRGGFVRRQRRHSWPRVVQEPRSARAPRVALGKQGKGQSGPQVSRRRALRAQLALDGRFGPLAPGQLVQPPGSQLVRGSLAETNGRTRRALPCRRAIPSDPLRIPPCQFGNCPTAVPTSAALPRLRSKKRGVHAPPRPSRGCPRSPRRSHQAPLGALQVRLSRTADLRCAQSSPWPFPRVHGQSQEEA